MSQLLDLQVEIASRLPGASETAMPITLHCAALQLYSNEGMFSYPLTKKERDDLSWYLEKYWKWPFGGFAQRGSAIEQLLPALGQRLYQATFGQGAARDIIQQWQAHTGGTHQISIITTDAGYLSLPWELLHNGQDFLALQANPPISIVRRTSEESPSLRPEALNEQPLRVLLVTARPIDEGQVDARTIAREVVDALQEQRATGAIELEFLRPPTLNNLSERLSEQERPIHILHFDGHGEFRRVSRGQDDNTEEEGRLSFEKEDGKKDSVDAGSLAEILHYGGVQIAVLNACQSAAIGERDSSSSVAIQLLKGGLRAVVAMSADIRTNSAVFYVRAFYRALAAGSSIQTAHQQAQQTLHGQLEGGKRLPQSLDEAGKPVNLQDWWLPYLYVQREQILSPLREENLQSPQPDLSLVPLLANTVLPASEPSEFIGRSAELLQIERSLLRKKIVAVSGFAGIGKTALVRESAAWLTRTGMYASWCFISFEPSSEYNISDLPAALATLASLLNQQRVLLILDDIESILPADNLARGEAEYDQLWKILTQLQNNGAGVLITGRYPKLAVQRFVSETQVDYLELKSLVPDDAYALATQVMNANHIDQTSVPYAELCDLLALLDNHPLAIRLTVPALQGLSLEKVQGEFASLLPTFRDNQVRGRNRSLLASLDSSLDRLSEAQRGLLPCLSLFKEGASEDDLLAITELPADEWASLRETLERTALLTVETIAGFTPPFLHFHPILVPWLHNQQGNAEETALRDRYMRRYFELTKTLYFEDKRDARMRLRVQKEWFNLCQTQEWLQEEERLEAAAFMTEATARFLTLFGRADERDAMRQRLSTTISEYGAPERGVFTHTAYMQQAGLAEEEFQRGNFATATARFISLLTRMEALPEGARLSSGSYEYCTMLFWAARSLDREGQYLVAEVYLRRALTIIELLIQQQPENEQRIQLRCAVLSDLAHTLRSQGKYAEATLRYEQALEVAKLGNRREQAVIALALGDEALERERDSTRAKGYFTRARQEFRALNEPINEANAWSRLGRVAEAQKDLTEAERCYREGLTIYERAGDTKSAAAVCNLLASVAITSERFSEAEEWYRRALRLDVQGHPDSPNAKHLLALANLLVREEASPEHLREAKDYTQQALAVFEASDDVQMIQATRNVLARIARMEGQIAAAESHRRREREAYAAFEGNRSRIDRIFGEIITDIATAAMGDTEMQHALEEAIRKFEPAGWNSTAAIQRIWAGERNWHSLVEEMENEPSLLILRVLETIALEEEEKASLQQAWEGFTEALPAPIYEAIQQRDEAAFERALEALPPEQQQQILTAIQALAKKAESSPLIAASAPPVKAETVTGQQATDAQSLSRLAAHYHRSGNDAEAETFLLQAIELYEQQADPDYFEIATSLTLLADCYKSQRKQEQIEALLGRAVAIYDHYPELAWPEPPAKLDTLTLHPEIAANLNTLALHYEALEKYAEAEALYKRAYYMFAHLRGAGHLDTIRCLNNLALLYKSLEFFAEAEPLLLDVLKVREVLLMPEHVDLASSLANLAECYDAQGKDAEAEPLYKRALQMREHILGSEHPDTVACLNNLALLYRGQQRYEEAESLLYQVLEIHERQLGTGRVDIETSLVLTHLYKKQKRYAEAEPLLRRVLAERERQLGPAHRDIVSSLTQLAECYDAQGKDAEAEPLYKHALQMQEDLLGPEHYETIARLDALALFYKKQERYAEAEPLYKRILQRHEHLLEPGHRNIISILNTLAQLYESQKRYEEAEQLLQRVLEERERRLGSEHKDVASSLTRLAECYDAQGRYTEAEPLYKRALQIQERLLGPEHPDLVRSLTNLAGMYYALEQYEQGEPLVVRALAFSEQKWGPADPKIVTNLRNVADIYYAQERYAEAEPLYQRVLAIREQHLGLDHPDTIYSLNELGYTYMFQEKYEEAERCFARVLANRERWPDSDPFDIIKSLNYLAVALERQGKYAEAEPFYLRVIQTREHLPSVDHLEIAQSLTNLAVMYYTWEQYEKGV